MADRPYNLGQMITAVNLNREVYQTCRGGIVLHGQVDDVRISRRYFGGQATQDTTFIDSSDIKSC